MRSIRATLLVRLLAGTALALAVAGTAVYFVVARSLELQFDRHLVDGVKGLASLLFQVEDHVEFEFSDQLMPEYEREERPDYFSLRFEDGELLERSDSLHGQDLVLPVPPTSLPSHWTAPLPDGRAGRFVAQLIEVHHVYPEEGPDRPSAARVVIVIARGLEDLRAAENRVLASCVLVALLLLGSLAFVSWAAVESGLRPATYLAATLDAIDVDHLPARLDAGELPSELVPVADKTDALIQRVDTALKRERRTSADIAHELRTPISELLTVSEVALRGRDAEEARAALATVRDVAWRLGRSVATLLKLARLEMGAETFEHAPVDLGEMVREVLRARASIQDERALTLENHVAPGASVASDGEVLRIVVANLLTNALSYSPPRGTVSTWLEHSENVWRFVAENTSTELAPPDLPALSQPFWRKDRARTDRDHSGLGLALSCALAERAGMTLAFELEAGTFRAVLSGSSAAPGSAGTAIADAG